MEYWGGNRGHPLVTVKDNCNSTCLDALLSGEVRRQAVHADEDFGGVLHIPIERNRIVRKLVNVGHHRRLLVVG